MNRLFFSRVDTDGVETPIGPVPLPIEGMEIECPICGLIGELEAAVDGDKKRTSWFCGICGARFTLETL